jgi:hypothetical protein
LAVGCWLLAVGCWLLAVGCWLLAVGCLIIFIKISSCQDKQNYCTLFLLFCQEIFDKFYVDVKLKI